MAHEQKQAQNRVDAKEDLVFLTSGAKEKLSKTIVGASETAYKMMHPFDKEGKEHATEKAKELKRQVSDKQAAIRATAHQQAQQERLGNAIPPTSPLCPNPNPNSQSEEREASPARPHMGPSPAQPSEEQEVFASQEPRETFSLSASDSGSSSDESSNRAEIHPTAPEYRSA